MFHKCQLSLLFQLWLSFSSILNLPKTQRLRTSDLSREKCYQEEHWVWNTTFKLHICLEMNLMNSIWDYIEIRFEIVIDSKVLLLKIEIGILYWQADLPLVSTWEFSSKPVFPPRKWAHFVMQVIIEEKTIFSDGRNYANKCI